MYEVDFFGDGKEQEKGLQYVEHDKKTKSSADNEKSYADYIVSKMSKVGHSGDRKKEEGKLLDMRGALGHVRSEMVSNA